MTTEIKCDSFICPSGKACEFAAVTFHIGGTVFPNNLWWSTLRDMMLHGY